MIRAAVEEAVAPLRDRVDGLEQTMLEAIVRASNPTRTSAPPRPSSRPAASQPPPLPPAAQAATGAPRAATSTPPQPKTAPAHTLDAEDAEEELTLPPPTAEQLTTPPAVQAFVVPAPVTPAPEAKDAAWEQMVRSSEQRRRMVMAVVAGVFVLGLGAFFGLLAACS
jgi:hypothetical protein